MKSELWLNNFIFQLLQLKSLLTGAFLFIKETPKLLGNFCVIFCMKRLWLILLLWISSLLGQTINIITSEAINSGSFQTVTEILQGRVPGLIGANLEGQGAARIRFRGTISMLRRNSPIIFVCLL